MKKLSTARKFKMITGKDVMRASKQLEKKQKDEESNDLTDLIEFIQLGLYLSFYETDLVKAKADFKEFLETGEFDTADETIKTLMEKFKAEFAG
ncbi:hypothetical protein [Pseudolactococcus laudensis]|uniref:hypothetical protein n=1 Tax=Pseudolactococcus laudensis TaxID=1494461 RepID=UPI002FC6956F